MKGIDFMKNEEKLDEQSKFIITAIILALAILFLPPLINSAKLTSIDSGFESEEIEEEILGIEAEEELTEEILDEEMLEEEEEFSEDEFNVGDSLNDKLMEGNVD